MPEEEEHFEFVDKRRTARSADDQPDTAERPQEATTRSDEAEARSESEHPRLAAADRLLMCLDILQQGAWIGLGLVPDPVTQHVERNLDEARQLIDGAAALAEIVEPGVDEPIRRELRTLIANLRLNYVQQVRRETRPKE